jgi:tetratricopeptide (TPR) repeat protein
MGFAEPTRRRFFASLIFSLALLWPLNAQSDEGARSAALGFVVQARALARAGSDSEAMALLERSLQVYPEFSEACYQYAQIRLRQQEDTRSGSDWLRRAIASNSWVDSSPEQAATELARVLVRSRRYGEARPVLTTLGARPGLGPRDDPEAALLWGEALLGQGDAGGAARYWSEALRRYPRDWRLYLHLDRALQRLGRPAEALEGLGRGRRELPEAAELSLEAARLTRERGERLRLLDEYAARGGEEPAATALALTLQPRDPPALLERFLRQGGNSRLLPLDMLIGYYRARPGKQAETLLQAVRAYSGQRIVDADEDGYYEEQYRLSNGSLEYWRLDQDQDGVPEAEVRFVSGAPQSLSAGGLEYRYSAYPFLAEVVVQDPERLRAYQLEPYRVRLELFRDSAVTTPSAKLRPLRLALRASRWPGEQAIRGWSYALLENGAGSNATALRRYTLSGGATLRMEESPDGQGRYGHVVEYSRGVPTSGMRDLDGDGRFELREQYTGGGLSALTLDQDGNGTPEYRQEFTPEGTRSLWDYNQDGVTDSRELERPGGEVVREFSSRLNGAFDARAVFRLGLLAIFQRAGQTLTVTAASAGSLYWVGRPGSSVEPFLSLSEGLHRVGERDYFLFTHLGKHYVVAL